MTVESGQGRAALWFGFLGGAFAWTAHLLAAYAIAEFGCFGGLAGHSWGGISAVAWSIIGVTIPAVAIAVAAVWIAGRAAGEFESNAGELERTDSFLARIGFYSSGIFLLVILAQTLPVLFFLGDCR
ncbi:MAG: hypothetical protein WD066_14695 [Planctomycetaceae bacterium]